MSIIHVYVPRPSSIHTRRWSGKSTFIEITTPSLQAEGGGGGNFYQLPPGCCPGYGAPVPGPGCWCSGARRLAMALHRACQPAMLHLSPSYGSPFRCVRAVPSGSPAVRQSRQSRQSGRAAVRQSGSPFRCVRLNCMTCLHLLFVDPM